MTDAEIWQSAVNTWETGAAELLRLKETVDPSAFQECVKVIANCKGRILTAGVGTSGAAAKKIAHTLCCVERPAYFLSPGDAVHGELGAAQKGDVAIVISKGGGTHEIVHILPALRAKGVYIIGVTENEHSMLAQKSDLLMKVKIQREADSFNMLATTSTLTVIALFDAVAIALMEYTHYTKEQFALIHPGGAVGERLLRNNY